MGAYLDRLNEQFETIVSGIDEILNRAVEENREVTDDESKLVEREQSRAAELKASIEHYSDIEKTRSDVQVVRSKIPAAPYKTHVKVSEPEYDITREFPTVGHYIATLHRAMTTKDQDAVEKIERAATAHQKLADNPGIVPRPILQPVISLVDASRPFIQAIGTKPLPAGSFDRPRVSQHVVVDKQANEKDTTASQKMKIDKLPVQATTYAGHLNISRQDIKWTQPGVLQIVTEDFAVAYAQSSDKDACTQFLASVSGNTPVPVSKFDGPSITAAIFGAAAATMNSQQPLAIPDAVFVSPDVWGQLGGLTNNQGNPVFPSLTPNSTTGNLLGLQIVVDSYFTPNTMVLGRRALLEWYEDVDGLITVNEPDVLGQLVGYAGFGAFLNTSPALFSVLTLPAMIAAAAK